ncbi:MAG TPA: low temperature requirement protein A [Stenomitos sp.]
MDPSNQPKTRRRLVCPPRLRTVGDTGERHATWLELYYDLVFAVAMTELDIGFSAELTLAGFLKAVSLFVPIWWAWVGHTVYATRFDTDDIVHRFFTFALMLAATAMAIQVESSLKGGFVPFVLSYTAARLCLILLYLRARRHVPEAHAMTSLYIGGFGVGGLLWGLSIWAPWPLRGVLWVVGIGVDLATPWVGRRIQRELPLDPAHFPERFGLFTLIVLGVSILGVIRGVAHVVWTLPYGLAGVLAFFLVACLWWSYFTFVDEAELEDTLRSGRSYIYGHLPLLIGLSSIGTALEHFILEAASPRVQAPTLWLMSAGVVLWLASLYALNVASTVCGPRLQLMAAYLGAILFTGLVAIFGLRLPSLAVLGSFCLLFSSLCVLEWRHFRHL